MDLLAQKDLEISEKNATIKSYLDKITEKDRQIQLLSTEKSELMDLLAQKDVEISEKNATIKSYLVENDCNERLDKEVSTRKEVEKEEYLVEGGHNSLLNDESKAKAEDEMSANAKLANEEYLVEGEHNSLLNDESKAKAEYEMSANAKLANDPGVCANSGEGAVGMNLFAEALERPLAPAEHAQVLDELTKESNRAGYTIDKLPVLVENNPQIAAEYLKKLTKSSDSPDYCKALVCMDMSFNSMEVVNRFTAAVKLPKEFITMYITKGMRFCKNNMELDRIRLTRALCVFIYSQIEKGIIDVNDKEYSELLGRIQAFCTSFEGIPEASAVSRRMALDRSG